MKKHLVIFATFTFVIFSSARVLAQADTSDDSQVDINQIENEIEKNVQKDSSTSAPPSMPPASSSANPTSNATPNSGATSAGDKGSQINDISDLTNLAPFSDVSVIERKFLPKTERFQFFAGATSIMNDPWFTNLGLSAKFGYFFTEQWGVELEGLFLSSSARDNIKLLQSNDGVNTSSIVTIKGYYGASVIWSPIYGKMGLFNKKIIPFDMFFALGGGSSQVDNGSGGTTIHLGTGQIFSITKAMAFRWDFAWNMVNAAPTGQSSQNFNNILLSAGFSFFFPEAGYR